MNTPESFDAMQKGFRCSGPLSRDDARTIGQNLRAWRSALHHVQLLDACRCWEKVRHEMSFSRR